MSISDRLFSITDQCRRENGDGFLRQPAQFVPRVTGQAPDLFSEIKALGRAFEMGAAERIQNAGDAESEAETVAREIAESENVSYKSVQSAVTVARRIGLLSATSVSGGEWAGDSMVVGAGGRATPQSPPIAPVMPHPAVANDEAFDDEDEDEISDSEPLWKNKWVMGGAALLVAFFFYSSQQTPPPQQIAQGNGPVQQGGPNGPGTPGAGGPGQTPGGGQGPGGGGQGPGGGGQGPTTGSQNGQAGPPLLNNDPNQMPRVRAETAQGGQMGVMFSIMTQNGPVPGMVMTPRNWTGGPGLVGFWPAGTTDFNTPMATTGSGPFQFFNNQGRPVRYIIPQWSNDNIGLGNICISFEAPQPMQETPLSGSQVCVRGGDCGEPAGCGIVQ